MSKIASKIRNKLIHISGYWIYKRKALPKGIDLFEDITMKFKMKNASTIFDVGANIGETTKAYSSFFKNSNVYSFEPFQIISEILKQRTADLNNVKCFNFAFGEKNDTIEVKYLPGVMASEVNSLKPEVFHRFENPEKQIVQVKTIDQFTEEQKIDCIDFLKIDTEGYEINVLKGAEKMLTKKKIKLIYAEVGFSQTRDKTHTFFPDLVDYLYSYGYLFFSLYGYNEFDTNYGVHYANALFVEKSVADKIDDLK